MLSKKLRRLCPAITLLAYPYFNKEFNIHTNTSDLQVGEVIRHKGKPVYLYTRKHTDAQKRYTVT